VCDGLVKGLKHPGWPLDAWEGLKRLSLLVMQHTASTSGTRGSPRLALVA
jgi:DNA polymerase-3 subunit delta